MKPQFRTMVIAVKDAAADSQEIEFALSSEDPYERWWGIEVLGHGKGEIDLSRLGDGRHPLFLGHDWEKQIGVVTKAWIDSKVLRASARFSRSPLAQEIKVDVDDKIRTLISVGYFVNEMVEEKEVDGVIVSRTLTGDEFETEMSAKHGKQWRALKPQSRADSQKPTTYRVINWTPFEASIVPVPADATVGIGRQLQTELTPANPSKLLGSDAVPEVKNESIPTKIERVKMTTEELAALAAKNASDAAMRSHERMVEMLKLGEQYAQYGGQKTAAEMLQSGKSTSEFLQVMMKAIETKHTDVNKDVVDLTKGEIQRFSLSRAVAAKISNDWSGAGFEREVSDAIGKAMGKSAEGFYMPLSVANYQAGKAQRDFNVGTAGEAGNLVATTLMMDEFVDVLRNRLVMGRLGATVLTGLTSNINIPRKVTAGAISRVTEIQALTETNPTTVLMPLSPKRTGAFVEPSKQAIIQVNASLDAMLTNDLLDSLAVAIEDQCFNGTGTLPAVRGILQTAGIGAVIGGPNGLQGNWGHIVGLESACANANAEPDLVAGYAVNTKTRGWYKTVQKAANLPFVWDTGAAPLNGYRAAVTNNLPSNGTKGTSSGVTSTMIFSSAWNDFIIAYFGALDVVVDPFTLATTGQVRITVNQFWDCLVRQPASFAAMTDLLTA